MLRSLTAFRLPAAALLCTDMCCKDVSHHIAISHYAEAITSALLSAAESNIPHTNPRHSGTRRIPGWSERVEPLRQKSLFWHGLWVDCGRPRNGVVADCMRRTRANYDHYAVRQVKRDEDLIVKERIANALIEDPRRNFWVEAVADPGEGRGERSPPPLQGGIFYIYNLCSADKQLQNLLFYSALHESNSGWILRFGASARLQFFNQVGRRPNTDSL